MPEACARCAHAATSHVGEVGRTLEDAPDGPCRVRACRCEAFRRTARCGSPFPWPDATEPCFLPARHVPRLHYNGWRRWDA